LYEIGPESLRYPGIDIVANYVAAIASKGLTRKEPPELIWRLGFFLRTGLAPPTIACPGVLVAFVVGVSVLFLVFMPVAEAAVVAAVGMFVASAGIGVERLAGARVAVGGIGAIAGAPVVSDVVASEAAVAKGIAVIISVAVPISIAVLVSPAVPVATVVTIIVPILRHGKSTQEQRCEHG